jgi:hypothetical protein
MSDQFQSYVFGEALLDNGRADIGRVTAYLLTEKIIGAEMAANTLEGDGHVPGAKAAAIIVKDNAYWRLVDVNGVRIETGRIIEASDRLESGQCPHCKVSIDLGTDGFQALDEAISAFDVGQSDDVTCPTCGTRTKLSEWDFGDSLAVGEAMVKFWNWPEHIDGIDKRFEAIAGMKCTKVWGRL